METIYLNSENCKEYSDEEIQAIINKSNEDESGFDIDWDVLLSDDIIEEEIVVEVESNFVKLTKELLAKAYKDYAYWEEKDYKKSKGSVYVGSELDGGNYSFNYINNKRRSDGMKNAMDDIKQYEKDLLNAK